MQGGLKNELDCIKVPQITGIIEKTMKIATRNPARCSA
jgi:hypothetical protein